MKYFSLFFLLLVFVFSFQFSSAQTRQSLPDNSESNETTSEYDLPWEYPTLMVGLGATVSTDRFQTMMELGPEASLRIGRIADLSLNSGFDLPIPTGARRAINSGINDMPGEAGVCWGARADAGLRIFLGSKEKEKSTAIVTGSRLLVNLRVKEIFYVKAPATHLSIFTFNLDARYRQVGIGNGFFDVDQDSLLSGSPASNMRMIYFSFGPGMQKHVNRRIKGGNGTSYVDRFYAQLHFAPLISADGVIGNGQTVNLQNSMALKRQRLGFGLGYHFTTIKGPLLNYISYGVEVGMLPGYAKINPNFNVSPLSNFYFSGKMSWGIPIGTSTFSGKSTN